MNILILEKYLLDLRNLLSTFSNFIDRYKKHITNIVKEIGASKRLMKKCYLKWRKRYLVEYKRYGVFCMTAIKMKNAVAVIYKVKSLE